MQSTDFNKRGLWVPLYKQDADRPANARQSHYAGLGVYCTKTRDLTAALYRTANGSFFVECFALGSFKLDGKFEMRHGGKDHRTAIQAIRWQDNPDRPINRKLADALDRLFEQAAASIAVLTADIAKHDERMESDALYRRCHLDLWPSNSWPGPALA